MCVGVIRKCAKEKKIEIKKKKVLHNDVGFMLNSSSTPPIVVTQFLENEHFFNNKIIIIYNSKMIMNKGREQ